MRSSKILHLMKRDSASPKGKNRSFSLLSIGQKNDASLNENNDIEINDIQTIDGKAPTEKEI